MMMMMYSRWYCCWSIFEMILLILIDVLLIVMNESLMMLFVMIYSIRLWTIDNDEQDDVFDWSIYVVRDEWIVDDVFGWMIVMIELLMMYSIRWWWYCSWWSWSSCCCWSIYVVRDEWIDDDVVRDDIFDKMMMYPHVMYPNMMNHPIYTP